MPTLMNAHTFTAPSAHGSRPLHPDVEEPILAGLEQVGFGVLMLSSQGVLQSANALAQQALDEARFICVEDGRLSSPQAVNSKMLALAVTMAARGRMQLVSLTDGDEQLRLTCMSVGDDPYGSPRLVSDIGLAGLPCLPKPVMVMLYPLGASAFSRQSAPVLNRFGEMGNGNVGGSCQVGNGSGHFHGAMGAAR